VAEYKCAVYVLTYCVLTNPHIRPRHVITWQKIFFYISREVTQGYVCVCVCVCVCVYYICISIYTYILCIHIYHLLQLYIFYVNLFTSKMTEEGETSVKKMISYFLRVK
jgi:hypothetical protein